MKSTLFKANNMAAFTLETDIHLQNPEKLMDEQMDKVRQIVHQKLKPFHFITQRITPLRRIIHL